MFVYFVYLFTFALSFTKDGTQHRDTISDKMESLKVVSINEKFIMRFVCSVHYYQKTANALAMVIDRNLFDYGDVTKETDPLTYSEGRSEVWFTVLCKNVEEGAFIKKVVNRIP